MPARLPVGEWQVVHFPSPLKNACTGFRITGQDVLDLEERRPAQPVVHLLPEEVREILDLRVGEVRARASRSAAVALLQERPELAAVAIAEHEHRAHEVRALVAAARLRAVAVDALARPDLAPAVSGRRVHHRLVARPGPRQHAPPPRPGGGPPCRCPPAPALAAPAPYLRGRRRPSAPAATSTAITEAFRHQWPSSPSSRASRTLWSLRGGEAATPNVDSRELIGRCATGDG